ncbi:MAG TPA: pyruvate kinase, partial [Clostridia bacterium]|nr:pyruvate kinase [Clostridia bacterium]
MEFARRTKIVATIGPASSSPEIMRQLLVAGMDVARLNFSHGSHEDHALAIRNLRQVSRELNKPVTILQDLQGPKVRVGQLAGGELTLEKGSTVVLVPQEQYSAQPATIPIDYPHVAAEAVPGMAILLADGLMELKVLEILPPAVHCEVVEGGIV